jgi:hypothetical protein
MAASPGQQGLRRPRLTPSLTMADHHIHCIGPISGYPDLSRAALSLSRHLSPQRD